MSEQAEPTVSTDNQEQSVPAKGQVRISAPAAPEDEETARLRGLIRTTPDPVLRQKAKPVRHINAAVREMLDLMGKVMYAGNGVGLAAPQVGFSKRAIVYDVGEGLHELINPEITRVSPERVTDLEGCLSVPGLWGDVERYETVQVTGFDRNGHRVWVEASGLEARAIQHEIDHLDGVLFTDKATNVREIKPDSEPENGADSESAPPEASGS